VPPAQEGLHADAVPGIGVHLRLVIDLELTTFERTAETILQRQPLERFVVHVGRVELIIVPALLSGPVEGRAGIFQQGVGVGAVGRVNADPGAGRDEELVAFEGEGQFQPFADPVDDLDRVLSPAELRQQQRELVALERATVSPLWRQLDSRPATSCSRRCPTACPACR
jgi:hypothetical protein